MKTFSKAQKVMAKVNPSDTVGVGKTQIVIPDFMKTYSKLFVESQMMENLLPRKITSSDALKKFNPYLLDDEDGYEEADYDGINEVSTFYSIFIEINFTFRVFLKCLGTCLTLEARDGGLSSA